MMKNFVINYYDVFRKTSFTPEEPFKDPINPSSEAERGKKF